MNTAELTARYRKLNESFSQTMVYHLGIDAGFFAEYTYMIHAMLYCLQHKIRFKLYADDANFGYAHGWSDYFQPFCEEVHEPFHHRFNTHRLPSCKVMRERGCQLSTAQLLKWKCKVAGKHAVGSLSAFFAYGQRVLLNQHVTFMPEGHFCIPELEIDGDYLHAFQKMTAITWQLNEEVQQESARYVSELELPSRYVGCQVRGGDKITETELLPPEHYVRLIKEQTDLRHVFVLTDDYRLFEEIQALAPDIHWYTLCSPEEKGYVNQAFTQSGGERKKRQMMRFLASMQVLMQAETFIGSITTGPSLFLLKNAYPHIHPADCAPEEFPHAATLPVAGRSRVATEYVRQLLGRNREYTADELNRLHAELYDILGETIRVCRKHDIPYFVIGGTAIGALYDQAILPWDDDIDIGMKREDYNRFLAVAPHELKPDYFLSWIESDPRTPYYFAKVKKRNTLFVEELFQHVPMHQGIFIDIFPFDRIPDNRFLRKVQRGIVNFLKCCLYGKEVWMWKYFGKCEVEYPTDRGPLPCLLNRIVDTLFTKKAIYRMMVAVQGCFNSIRTRYYNNVITTTDHVLEENLEDLQEVPFGPLAVTAPKGLEAFLRYNYPKLHRFTPEEVKHVNNHYPAQLSFCADETCNP